MPLEAQQTFRLGRPTKHVKKQAAEEKPLENLDNKSMARIRCQQKTDTSSATAQATGCWLFNGATLNEAGYGVVINEFGKPELAHRYAYRQWHGEIPKGKVIGHSAKCPHRNCISPLHLKAMTQKENIQMASEALSVAKRKRATPEEIKAIRDEYAAGTKIYALSKKYDRSMNYISRVVSGKLHNPNKPKKSPKSPKPEAAANKHSVEVAAIQAQRAHLQDVADRLDTLIEAAETKRAA